MPAHGFASILGGGDFSQHLRIGLRNTWKIHHFTQTDDSGPLHRLGDIRSRDFKAGGFQPRRAGRTTWHLGEHINRLHQSLIMHHTHTGQPQYIGNLMRVGEHAGGAMRDHGSGEFRRGQHAAFNMHMRITQAGQHKATLCLDHLGLGP